MEKIIIKTKKQQEIIDITEEIKSKIKQIKINNGICFIYNPHTTCAVSINEGYDETVKDDILNKLNELISVCDNYKHLEGNSHAHIKSVLCGNNIFFFIENGNIFLGRWQSIYLMEFDGPRTRELWMKIL